MLLSQNIGNNNEIDNNYWYFHCVEQVFLLLQLPQNIWNPRMNINITSFSYCLHPLIGGGISLLPWWLVCKFVITLQSDLIYTWNHKLVIIVYICTKLMLCETAISSSDPQHQTNWTIKHLLKYSYSNITKYYFEGGCHIKSLGDPCFAEIKTIHFIRIIIANCITYFHLIWN